MKENYASWAIGVKDFPENGDILDQLKFLIGFAVLAPSGHNSQPWEFAIEGNSIKVFVSKERSLEKSDPDLRQTLISIGCAIENLLTAATYYGFEAKLEYLPDIDKRIVASISFERKTNTKKNPEHLINFISKRNSNRGKYRLDSIPEIFKNEINKISNSEIEITLVENKQKRDLLSDIANKAQIEVMDRDSFREELSHYVKSNFTKSKTGMPGFTIGIPALISIFISKIIKRVNVSRKFAKQDVALLKKFTPAFLVISSKNDSKESWVKAGQLFEKAWLVATKHGLSCSVLAAGVQVGEYYKKVKEIIGTNNRPLIFSRLGFAKKNFKHSPRLGTKDVMRND